MLNLLAQIEYADRHVEWIAAGEGFANLLGTEAAIQIQGLGRLDMELIWADENAKRLSEGSSLEAAIWSDASHRITLSRLWVLGGYELVRVLAGVSKPPPVAVTLAKASFERVRMPLAKLEAARKHRSTDFSVATPIVHNIDGIGWLVSPNVFLTRRSLANTLLELGKSLNTDSQQSAQADRHAAFESTEI